MSTLPSFTPEPILPQVSGNTDLPDGDDILFTTEHRVCRNTRTVVTPRVPEC